MLLVIVDTAVYRGGKRLPLECGLGDLVGARASLQEEGDFLWVGLHDPAIEELEDVAIAFALHPLAIEDALKAHQRPKLEMYDDSLFLVLKTIWYVDVDDAVETGEIGIFVGPDFVVTVRHGDGTDLSAARRSLEARRSVLASGPASVVYAVCDYVVDSYEHVADALAVDVDEVEESVFSEARTNDAPRIYTLKRELAEMRRAVSPLKDPLRRFTTGSVPGFADSSTVFFRDVADHLYRVAETIDSLDQLLSTALDAPGGDLGAAERGHAQDLRRRRAGRRTHADRRGLRDELRSHPRVALGLRLSVLGRPDGAQLGGVVDLLQALRLVVIRG